MGFIILWGNYWIVWMSPGSADSCLASCGWTHNLLACDSSHMKWFREILKPCWVSSIDYLDDNPSSQSQCSGPSPERQTEFWTRSPTLTDKLCVQHSSDLTKVKSCVSLVFHPYFKRHSMSPTPRGQQSSSLCVSVSGDTEHLTVLR